MGDYFTIGKNDIENIYNEIRMRNERELTARRRKIFTEVPELEQLDREISREAAEIRFECWKKIAEGKDLL